MKISLTNQELNKIYQFTSGLNNKGANKVFNSCFTDQHLEIIKQSVNQQEMTLELEVDEEISLIFLDAFVKNSPNISTLFNSSKVSLLCNAKSVFDKLSRDVRTAVDMANKAWIRKNHAVNILLKYKNRRRQYVLQGLRDL